MAKRKTPAASKGSGTPTITTWSYARRAAFIAIDSERSFQESLITQAGSDRSKPVESYVLYMDDYMRELKTQLSRDWTPACKGRALNTLRKIAALATACMEEHGAPKRTFELATVINTVGLSPSGK